MKQTLFLIAAVVIAATACTKKSTPVNCWACVSHDSVTSNIPALANPHYKTESGLTCQRTEAQKDFYVKENTKVDTLLFRNDTLVEEHLTMDCEVAY
jgi:hypothetical protein